MGHKKAKSGNKKRNPAIDAFVGVALLGMSVAVFWLVMFLGQDQLSQIVLLNFIITLGGSISYMNSVIGVGIIWFLFGMVLLAMRGFK